MLYEATNMLGAGNSASPAASEAPTAPLHTSGYPTAPTIETTPPAFRAAKGTWFDEGLDFREPEGEAFTRHVIELIAPFEDRKNKRSEGRAANHSIRVRKLLANGLRCFYYFDPALVSFFRRAGRLKNKPLWFTGTGMSGATDALEKAGLIELNRGGPGSASTYELTEALLFAALDFGVTEDSLVYRLPRERLVRLYETNREGPYVDFDPTGDTERSTARLEQYNSFLDQQDIALVLSLAEQARMVEGWNYKRDKDLPRYLTPELLRTHLFRQFNNASFAEGGRLYGGWWIGVPAHLRSRITINGEATVELDYSGCAIRMLYHERGRECPDDPYHLAPIAALEAEKGYQPGHYREAIKALTQARINGGNRDKDMMCDLPGGVSFASRFTRNQVTAMIEAKHEAIADAFGSGAGIRLQRKDSDLALSIITALMKQGTVALPIHDSFIVEARHQEALFEEMNSKYKNMFGYYPEIK